MERAVRFEAFAQGLILSALQGWNYFCASCYAYYGFKNGFLAKPLPTLRKEIGGIIASEHGIFEASRYLRHSDIRITSAIYADKKKVVTPTTFAGLLGSGPATENPIPGAAPPP